MKQITFGLGALLFVAVSGLFVVSVREVRACPGTSTVHWDPNPMSVARSGTDFHTDGPSFVWQYASTPFVGSVDIAASEFQVNIASVTYTPAYWFPGGCEDWQQVDIEGTLVSAGTGQLTTIGSMTSPYREQYHDLEITN